MGMMWTNDEGIAAEDALDDAGAEGELDAAEEGLRHSLATYVDDWATDKADEARGDADAARAAGRREAIGFLDEEIAAAEAAQTEER